MESPPECSFIFSVFSVSFSPPSLREINLTPLARVHSGVALPLLLLPPSRLLIGLVIAYIPNTSFMSITRVVFPLLPFAPYMYANTLSGFPPRKQDARKRFANPLIGLRGKSFRKKSLHIRFRSRKISECFPAFHS